MMAGFTVMKLRSALSSAQQVVRAATGVSQDVDDLADRDPERAERLRAIADQMYAVLDVARDIEKELAELTREANRAG